MLVIISDLHLTDGTSGSTISPEAFQLLAERLGDLGLSASHRRDGTYRPIERVDLVLLGDVLDVIRSTQWLQNPIRPWDDPKSGALFDTVAKITGDTLIHNNQALSEFRNLAERGIALPPLPRVPANRPAAKPRRSQCESTTWWATTTGSTTCRGETTISYAPRLLRTWDWQPIPTLLFRTRFGKATNSCK